MMYVRFSLSLQSVEDLLFERGIGICHETVRLWWNRFGPMFAADIRRQRISRMCGFRHWRRHLDEVFVQINGETHYLWRAVDHEGEILESYVTKKRDKSAVLRFFKKTLKWHGSRATIVTDGLKSYPAAMKVLGVEGRREMGRWKNNRAENSHLPFRRRERVMLRFRQMKSLQKLTSVNADVHNQFASWPFGSTRIAISSIARLIMVAARPHWLSGRISWPDQVQGKGELRQPETSSR